ncbi:hypothetical protein [Pseudoalteromonas piscicida]|uniref:Uncharacterized protein n=1 Tax=Pseudoalteromonas piscicida TaxID=43662 RepID=A0A2A5JRA9_PSEO7|nr:hypothetical protein [Pseudoalteromonas piscicida]PCK31946.1 hypothetical protein CEX98_09820 [Pseudoalteromonas piscicida]
MKSSFVFLISCFISFNCFSNESVEFTINANKSGNEFLITAKGKTDNASELLDSWLKKAKELCGAREVEVEPNDGKPIVSNTGCGDAIKIENGIQKCELIKAAVFGKVLCVAVRR